MRSEETSMRLADQAVALARTEFDGPLPLLEPKMRFFRVTVRFDYAVRDELTPAEVHFGTLTTLTKTERSFGFTYHGVDHWYRDADSALHFLYLAIREGRVQ